MNFGSFDPSTMTWATQMAHPQLGEGIASFQQDVTGAPELADHQSVYSYGLAPYVHGFYGLEMRSQA